MTWAFAPAWALAAALLLPLAAHLLSRVPPRRVPFPSLRFLRVMPAVSRRFHTLHDVGLWALRSLIVLVIVAAAAGPTVVTSTRRASWMPEAARAIVRVEDGQPADERSKAREKERQYRDPILRHALAAAVADAPATGPYEIHIQWDGRRASLDASDLQAIPPGMGLTLVRDPWSVSKELFTDSPAGDVSVSSQGSARPAAAVADRPQSTGREPAVRILAPGDAERTLWLARAGPPDPIAWRVHEHMRADPRLTDAAQRSRPDDRVAEEPKSLATFAPLARDADGAVVAWGASAEGQPLVVLDTRPADPLSMWASVVAEGALWAIAGALESDAGMWTDDEMVRAHRPAERRGGGDLPGGLDTRAAWTAVFLLLAAEVRARRRVSRRDAASVIQDDAA